MMCSGDKKVDVFNSNKFTPNLQGGFNLSLVHLITTCNTVLVGTNNTIIGYTFSFNIYSKILCGNGQAGGNLGV